jgi:hypothetical protein
MHWGPVIVVLLSGGSAWAQENQLQADFRRESEHVRE